MAQTYFCGKFGSCAIDGVVYPISSWELNSEVTTPEISNFTVPLGQQMFCPNLISGNLTCEGFLSNAGLPSTAVLPGFPTAGGYAAFTLGYGPALSFTVNALITAIDPSQDINDVGRFTIEAVLSPNPADL